MRVAVVGAGIAGLTAALRLAQRGYEVTVYEETEMLGGNLSSQRHGDVYYDVYPHMFCEWYANFWEIFEKDLGLDRRTHFEPRAAVKLLRKGAALLHKGTPEYLDLTGASTLRSVWHNLRSGVLPFPDMFLLGFSMLDLASQPFDRSELLSGLSVNGFLYSRPYASERCADLHDYILMEIWSIHGDLTSAAAYKHFLRRAYSFGRSIPFAWMLKGSLQEKLIAPLSQAIVARPGCTIRTGCGVKTVRIENGKATIELAHGEPAPADAVVLAVHAKGLADLVMRGPKRQRIVDWIPQLSELRRLRAERIPVVNLYFKRKLPGIPREHVGLIGSDSDLTFLDISQLWTDDPTMRDQTVLVLAASDFYALPSLTPHEDGYAMIHKLREYVPVFDPGKYWGDPEGDICWKKTRFLPNDENKLFINEVGAGAWRPTATYQAVPNLFFAGDFCQTSVDMATIEAAVQSGIRAAQALCRQEPSRTPVVPAEYNEYSDTLFIAAKLALLPSAYWAKWWSIAIDAAPDLSKGDLAGGVIAPAASMLLLPFTYTVDWLETSYAFWKSALYDRDWLQEGTGGSRVLDRLSSLWQDVRTAFAGDAEDDDDAVCLTDHRRRWRVKP